MADKVGIEINVDSSGAIKSVSALGKKFEITKESTKELDKSIKVLSNTKKILDNQIKNTSNSIDKSNLQLKRNALATAQSELQTEKYIKELKELNNETAKTNNLFSVKNLTTLVTIGSVVKLSKEIIELKDNFSLMRSQIRLVIDNEKNLDSVQNLLLKTANETRQSIDSTIELYTKLDRATKQLGLTDKEVIGLTKTLNQAFIISGASAEDARNGVRQFGQAVQGGILRAEELNSILEQTPRIAQIFAESMGKTQGEFRKLVIDGKITSEQLVDAIRKQTKQINEEFGKVEETSGQTWTTLKNDVTSYINNLESLNRAQKLFNDVLKSVKGIVGDRLEKQNAKNALSVDVANRSLEQQEALINAIEKEINVSKSSIFFRSQLELGEKLLKIEKNNLEIIRKRIEQEDIVAKQRQEEIAEKNKLAEAEAKRKKEREEQLKEYNKLIKTQEQQNWLLKEQIILEQQQSLSDSDIESEIEYNKILKNLTEERNLLNLDSFGKKIELIEREKNERLKSLLDLELSEEDYAKVSQKIFENSAKKKSEIEKQQINSTISAYIGVAGTVNQALKDIFGDSKEFAIADIIINTARGIQRSFADLPFPLNGIQATAIGASGVAQIAKVNSQKFANGTEYVTGNGTNRSDSVPARLSVGERVVDSYTNSQLGGISNDQLLDAVRGRTGANITINAGIGSDAEMIAQAVVNALKIAEQRGMEPQLI